MMNTGKTVSVVIVYTDLKKYQEAIQWLETQSVWPSIELIALDNREQRFSSCAQALNYGAMQSSGKILVFMHQDVYLWDSDAIKKLYDYAIDHTDEIIGVAGKCHSGEIITDIFETKSREYRGIRANGKILEVASVDECLFAMPTERWELLRFDEKCCDNWHGYAVDICHSNTLNNGKNILLPLEICHESRGNSQTTSFRRTVRNLVKKYRKTEIKRIQGTCVDISCNWTGYFGYRTHCFFRDILVKLNLLKYFSAAKKRLLER